MRFDTPIAKRALIGAVVALTAAFASVPGSGKTSDAASAGPAGEAPEASVAGSERDPDSAEEDGEDDDTVDLSAIPDRLSAPPIASARPLAKSDDLLARARLKGGHLVLNTKEGERTLTIVPALQKQLTEILQRYETPYAAVVALDPKTGRVLAMAEHAQADPTLRGLPVKAIFPAASIFKIVTGAALLDAGLKPSDEVCSFGGKRKLAKHHIEDTARDRMCLSLSTAMATSANAIFAKMTAKHLTREALVEWAQRFQFNKQLDFPVPTDVSLAAVPEDPFELAKTGAGFGDVYLSPLHGAALAAIAANEGHWRAPVLFEDDAPHDPVPVMTADQAELMTGMLEDTVTRGTARRIFRERGYRVPGAVGKTGSLADKKPFRDYSWFVGFAPKEDPKVAVAAVIVNDAHWRIRATWLGREAMRLFLAMPQSHVSETVHAATTATTESDATVSSDAASASAGPN